MNKQEVYQYLEQNNIEYEAVEHKAVFCMADLDDLDLPYSDGEARKAGTLTMEIRTASLQDLEDIAAVEAACFPVAEAATKAEFAERIQYYGDHFFLLYDNQKLVAFVDGFVTDEQNLTDEMYEKASLHNENGAWQMIFGVNTLPEYRRNGYAGRLLCCAIDTARKQGRKGVVLTCKEKLIHYYSGFGFVNEGISTDSTHGNAVWYQMRLTF